MMQNVDIRELMPDDLEPVMALLRQRSGSETGQSPQSPDTTAAAQLRPGCFSRHAGIRLVAERDGQIVGFLLCRYNGQIEHLVVSDAAGSQDVARALVDKAMLKMRSMHIGRCQILLSGDEVQRHFWAGARWLDPADAREHTPPPAA